MSEANNPEGVVGIRRENTRSLTAAARCFLRPRDAGMMSPPLVTEALRVWSAKGATLFLIAVACREIWRALRQDFRVRVLRVWSAKSAARGSKSSFCRDRRHVVFQRRLQRVPGQRGAFHADGEFADAVERRELAEVFHVRFLIRRSG